MVTKVAAKGGGKQTVKTSKNTTGNGAMMALARSGAKARASTSKGEPNPFEDAFRRTATAPGGGRDLLDDLFVQDAANAMTRLRAIDAAITGDLSWRFASFTIFPGVDIEIPLPREMVVEMDGVEVFDLLFKAAEQAAMAVVTNTPKGASWKDVLSPVTAAVSPAFVALVAECMIRIMVSQGWKEVTIRGDQKLNSPFWLNPPIHVNKSAVVAHVRGMMEDVKLPEIEGNLDDFFQE